MSGEPVGVGAGNERQLKASASGVGTEATISSEATTREKAVRISEHSSAKRFAYKNLYGLSIGFTIANSSFIGLQNLQSSINSSGGLGVTSLAILYAVYVLCGFISPGFIKVFGTKVAVVVGILCISGYAVCNYYPTWYTLILGAFLIGASSVPSLAAINAHLAEVAKDAAPELGKKPAHLISKFTGVYYFFYQFSQFPGNLASSLILFPYGKPDENASDTSGSGLQDLLPGSRSEGVCEGFSAVDIDHVYHYSLVSVYLLFTVIGLVIVLLFVDHLPTENSFLSMERKFYLYFRKPFVRLVRVLKHRHMLLIAPMVLTSGMENAFAFGTFTELFISDCFGVYLVGFTLILFGFCSAATSMAYSKVVKYVPLLVITLFAASLNIGVIIFLLIWERAPSYGVIFSFAVVWGMADAIWNTVPTSWTGILFSDRTEVAYSAMRIWQGLGFCAGFATAKLLPLEGRLGTLCGVVVLAAMSNIVIHFTTKPKQTLCSCCRAKTAVQVDSTDTSRDSIEDDRSGPTQFNERRDSLYDAPPAASAGLNTMFEAYQGKRPSACSDSRPPSMLAPAMHCSINEEEEVCDDSKQKQSDAVAVWPSRSPSYMHAMSAATEGT